MEQRLTASCIRLDRRNMSLPAGIVGGEYYQVPAGPRLSLRCPILASKDLGDASPSLKLSERLTSFWCVIWSWIKLMHSFLDDKDFKLTFRIPAKTIVLSILFHFAGYDNLKPILRGTVGIAAFIFEPWNLEAKCYDFDPSNHQYDTSPAAALAMNFYLPEQNLDWRNASMSAAGRIAVDVASVALIHLIITHDPHSRPFPIS